MKNVSSFRQKVKIAIDPKLRRRFGPEIYWTWRLVFSAIGLPWEEVPLNASECDVAYLAGDGKALQSRFRILPNVHLWEERVNSRSEVANQQPRAHPAVKYEDIEIDSLNNGDGLVCKRDIILDIFWLVTREEEAYFFRDRHGHYTAYESTSQQPQFLRLAMGSSIVRSLENIFKEIGFITPIPRWPHNKRAAACLSHDVDYPEVLRWLEPLRIMLRRGWRGLSSAAAVLRGAKTHWHFQSWMQLEQNLDVRSAFYFVATQGSLRQYIMGIPDSLYDIRSAKFRNLFNLLKDQGFEIGLHASYNAYKSKETFAAEKRLLEEQSGQQVHGNRHHYWHLDPQNVENTLLLHEQLGFKYDTSLSHERYVGWRRGLSWPYFPFHQKQRRELRTLQIPTAWMDDQLFGHKQNNPGDRNQILQALADTTAEQGGCFMVDVHDYVYDSELYPGWADTYRWLLEHLRERTDFWIATPGEIAEHWRERHNMIAENSRGLVA